MMPAARSPAEPRVALPAAAGPVIGFTPSSRVPDPRIEILDPAFLKLRVFPGTIEQLVTGLRWAEGPVWFGDGRYLLVSDIPGNQILRWDACSGATSVFRAPSNHANGLARDRQGRLLSCEHLTRRITRTEYDGRITVLADSYQGKQLNSPNDLCCASDGSIWFTDPPFGISGYWEGEPAAQELPDSVYRIGPDGRLQAVLTNLAGPNGLAFSPDESVLYVVESRARPARRIWAYDVALTTDDPLSNKRLVLEASDHGALDGIAVDAQGHLWCGWGSDGTPGLNLEQLDGVRVFNPQGQALAHIHLPERCANLCFGGRHRDRLFMAATHSVYALNLHVQGAI